jgi:hypothetical protein
VVRIRTFGFYDTDREEAEILQFTIQQLPATVLDDGWGAVSIADAARSINRMLNTKYSYGAILDILRGHIDAGRLPCLRVLDDTRLAFRHADLQPTGAAPRKPLTLAQRLEALEARVQALEAMPVLDKHQWIEIRRIGDEAMAAISPGYTAHHYSPSPDQPSDARPIAPFVDHE